MPCSFEPIINKNSEILILGTMPSTISLEEDKYYANTNNQFWDIIYSIFNSKIHNDYKQRCEFLLDNKIALWDVLKYADREGNLDNAIKNEKPNDISELLKEFTNIRTIIFNGSAAERYFKKYFRFLYTYKKCLRVSSSSPTPGKNVKSISEKKLEWKIVINK